MSDATRQSRLADLRAERRAAVDALDPNAMDDWPLERIVELAEEVERLQRRLIAAEKVVKTCIEFNAISPLFPGLMEPVHRWQEIEDDHE